MDVRQLRIRPPQDEIFDPLGPMEGFYDEEPDGAEVKVDYEENKEYIGTADYVIRVRSTGEEIERIPAHELHGMTEAGMSRRLTRAWDDARRVKQEFLDHLQQQVEEEKEEEQQKEKASKGAKAKG